MQTNENKETVDETEYLLKSEANAKRLLESVERIKHGESVQRDLIED